MSKAYATLTEPEKWEWHADVYAFRRIVLDVANEEKTSPCDPDGRWCNEPLIRQSAERLQERRHGAARRRRGVIEEALRREGRGILNRWARDRGYPDWEHAYEAGHAFAEVVASLPGGMKAMPRERYGRTPLAQQLGAVATEWKPSPEQMRKGLDELSQRGDVSAVVT